MYEAEEQKEDLVTVEVSVTDVFENPESNYSISLQQVIDLNNILSLSYEDVFFNANSFEKELKEVTSSKILGKKKSQATSRKIFHENGLFSEQIFGPVASYKCQCPSVRVSQNEICPVCGIKITSSVERRKTYAKIPTLFVLSSEAAMLIKNVQFLNKIYDNIITRKTVIISKNDLSIYKVVDRNKTTQEQLDEIYSSIDQDSYYIVTVIYELPKIIKEYYNKNKSNKKVELLVRLINEGRFFTDYVLVIPPDLRPLYKIDELGSNVPNDINTLYVRILHNLDKNIYKDTTGYDSVSLSLIGNTIEYYVDRLRNRMIEELKSKEGILRSTLSKRIDFSARGVIVPHNDKTNIVYVPKTIMLEILKLRIARNLSSKYQKPVQFFIPEIEDVRNKISSQYESQIEEELNKILKSDYIRVIINRQPTLHRGSMYSMNIKIWEHNAVGIPKTICSSMNADFDGDTVAMYFILDEKLKNQVEMMKPENNMINYQDLSFQLIPKQDIIYAFYKLTSTEDRRRSLVEQNLLPEKYKDTVVNSKVLSKLLLEVNDIGYLDKVVGLANIYTDLHPITLSPLDFIIGTDKKELRDNKFKFVNNPVEDFKMLQDIEKELQKRFVLSDLIVSGARGKFEQVRQLTHYRGYLTDFYGKLIQTPITKNYIDKFSINDLYNSSKGVRKSLYDQHGTISKSGYLYRKLSFSTISALRDKHVDDCGTKRTIRIYVPDENFAKTLMYRYYYEEDPLTNENQELKQVTDPSSIVDKVIFLRSPITCSSSNYCKKCYPYNIETPYVGIVASQSICERTSQLSLRTFHTSGIATGVSKQEKKKAEDISNHLDQIIRHFDSTIPIQDENELISTMIDIHSILTKYGNIQLIHLELVTSERLFANILYNSNQYLIPYRVYINKFIDNQEIFDSVSYLLQSVKKVPHLKSETLGLLFQNTKVAVANLIKSKLNNENIRTTPLDKIVLFFSSF